MDILIKIITVKNLEEFYEHKSLCQEFYIINACKKAGVKTLEEALEIQEQEYKKVYN